MQLIKRFWKQLLGMISEDSRDEQSEENSSAIALKKHMLFEGNFNKDIKYLYALGRSSYQPSELNEENISIGKLWEKLGNLHCLLGAWEDSGLDRKNKKERHALKHKKDLAKPIRRAIHKALDIEAINLANICLTMALDELGELKVQVKDSKNIAESFEQLKGLAEYLKAIEDKEVNKKISGEQLIELTAKCLHALKIMEPDLKSPDDKDIEKRFKKAANAITSFKTLQQKILASLSISVAIIASLACGFFTAGAIFTLISGGLLSGLVIPIIVIVGLVGFTVNVRFFSKSLPEFLLKLTNLSRVTEFINEKGDREQLTNLKKYVYLPFAALFSVSVGIASAAFSMALATKMLATVALATTLAATGPLPLILAVILAIAMTIVMFKAFVETAPNISFSQLWLSLKTEWKERSFMKFLSYGITLAVCGMGIFGLFMGCYTGFETLAASFGSAASIFVLVTSFVGQVPFTVLTISTFCKAIGNFLLGIPGKVKSWFRQAPAQSTEAAEKSAWLNKIGSVGLDIIDWVAMPVLLIINAIANGASLQSGIPPSISKYVADAAGSAGALNSISGNLVSDNKAHERSQADNAAIRELKVSLKPKDPLMSDNKTQKCSQVDKAAQDEPSVPKANETSADSGAKTTKDSKGMTRSNSWGQFFVETDNHAVERPKLSRAASEPSLCKAA